jgi:hypothetical protein
MTMTHVNLDTQPEVVRQFVLGLSVTTDGVILESAGRPVACVVPPPKSSNGSTTEGAEWTDEKNRRRCELIDRKYDHGLTPAEEAELAVLQDAMYRFIDQVAPLPLGAALLRRLLGYPDDLPDLAALRPPESNARPDGIVQSHFARRQRGVLPDSY